jgi:ArsR family transcriptional regulator
MREIALIDAACCAPGAPVLDPEAAAALAEGFKALADPTRIAIVNRLAGAGEVCVCDITDAFDLGQPTISHHLKVLREAGLVTTERRGRWAYYSLGPEAVARLGAALRPA